MKQYNYSQHHIKEFNDLDKLRIAVLEHGNFGFDDLVRFTREIDSMGAPHRWHQYLRIHLAPLVGALPKVKVMPKAKTQQALNGKKKKQAIAPEHIKIKADDEVYNRKYKASNFKIENGYIEVGGVRLESRRVTKTSRDILDKIDIEFNITKDYSGKNRFMFVPRTDLTVLLDAIEKYRPVNKQDDYYNDLCSLYYSQGTNNYNIQGTNSSLARTNYNSSRFETIKSKIVPHLDASTESLYSYENIPYSTFITPETYGPEILFDILKTFNIIAGNSCLHKFEESLYQCNVMVDMKYVTVSDGHIDIKLTDHKFLYIPWERLCQNAYKQAKNESLYWIADIKKEMQEFIIGYLSTYFSRYKVLGKIRVNTHISAKCFYELFDSYRRDIKSNPITYDSAKYNDMCCNLIEPNKLVIPFHYLKKGVNSGYDVLLYLMRETRKDITFKNLFTSDATKYFDKTNHSLLQKLSAYECLSKQEEEIKNKLMAVSKLHFIREVTPYYRNRFKAKGWLNDKCPERLFRFYENCARDKANSEITGIGHISYVAIDAVNCRIMLCSTNADYKHIIFKVASTALLDIAALVVMRYFNSPIKNKRLGFKIPNIFRQCGIQSFKKTSDLDIAAYKMENN